MLLTIVMGLKKAYRNLNQTSSILSFSLGRDSAVGKKRQKKGKNIGSAHFARRFFSPFSPMRSLVPGYLSFFIVRRAKRAMRENDRVRD